MDAFEPKTMVTRKLRRRHYEPLPIPEKRRKLAPLSSLVYVLDEHEVDDDLKVIFKVSSVLHNYSWYWSVDSEILLSSFIPAVDCAVLFFLLLREKSQTTQSCYHPQVSLYETYIREA